MSNEGSVLRAALILVVAVILVISAFSLFRVVYPTSPQKGTPGGQTFKLFLNQVNDTSGLGANETSFSPVSQSIVLIEGIVYNNSSALPIVSSRLFVAVFPVETVIATNSYGVYQYYIMYRGNGDFAYKIPGYYPRTVHIDAGRNIVWANMSMEPMPKYKVAGNVSDAYDNRIADVGVTAADFYQAVGALSGGNGSFAMYLTNGSYRVRFSGINYIALNVTLNVSGRSITNLSVRLTPSVPSPFSLGGYVLNTAGHAVANATLSTFPILNGTKTGADGHFTLKNMYGSVKLNVSSPGYSDGSFVVTSIVADRTDLNLTMHPLFSIGQGLHIINLTPSSQTGDPSTNATSLVSILSSANPSGPVSYAPASLSLGFSDGGSPLPNIQYLAYIDSAGIFYRGTFGSGSQSTGSIRLNFSGSYSITVLTLFYGRYSTSSFYSGSSSLSLQLSKQASYNLSINASDQLHNFSVPAGGISVSNSLFTLPFVAHASGNSTVFKYSLPDGGYSFSYTGPGYVNASVAANISGNNVSVNLPLFPYVVVLTDSSNLTWNVSLTSSTGISNTTLSGNTALVFQGHIGNYSMASTTMNGTYPLSASFSISAAIPVITLYFNRTFANISSAAASRSFNATTGIYNATFTMSTTAASALLLDGLQLLSLNFTPSLSTAYISHAAFSFAGNSTVFAHPHTVEGGILTINLISSGLNSTDGNDMVVSLVLKLDYSIATVTPVGSGYTT